MVAGCPTSKAGSARISTIAALHLPAGTRLSTVTIAGRRAAPRPILPFQEKTAMESLLYVSSRQSRDGLYIRDVEDIVSPARTRNAALDVTGALVATPTHYAQMLEGSRTALDELLGSIGRDERHTDMRLIHLEPQARRELARWSLAYSGDSTYVAQLITAAMAAPDFEMETHFASIRALIMMLA
jgi:hypothetical protein